jgi:hypothetical protein
VIQTSTLPKFLIQPTEKTGEFLAAVPLMALSDHAALQYFQRGEQGSGSVALVVVRHGAATAF